VTYVVWLDEAPPECAPLLGGKLSSLAEMLAADFGVPPAFGVTTDAYRGFMEANGLRTELRDLDRGDLRAVEAASAQITRQILDAPMPEAVADAIREAYAELCRRAGADDVPVAVRSSGVAEDLAGASFAGQYDTYLEITGADAVIDHVRRCWTGLFGPQVLTYRPDAGEPPPEAMAMAVGVQQMIKPRAAGVMFTLDPVTGDRSKIVIEGVPGLGEALVSGEATPDRFRVDKVTLEILAREPASPDDGTCLDDDQIRELAQLAKRIERHRKAPQDIEWAVDEHGQAHVLQVRPETVWSRREAKPVAAKGSAMDMVMGKFMGGKKG